MKVSRLFLERPRAIRTLICLLENEGKGLDEILEAIGGSKTTGMRRIAELSELKLVEKRASPKEIRKILYSLTEEGKIAAIELRRLAEMIEKAKANAQRTRE